jgi:hypothetical protein
MSVLLGFTVRNDVSSPHNGGDKRQDDNRKQANRPDFIRLITVLGANSHSRAQYAKDVGNHAKKEARKS